MPSPRFWLVIPMTTIVTACFPIQASRVEKDSRVVSHSTADVRVELNSPFPVPAPQGESPDPSLMIGETAIGKSGQTPGGTNSGQTPPGTEDLHFNLERPGDSKVSSASLPSGRGSIVPMATASAEPGAVVIPIIRL